MGSNGDSAKGPVLHHKQRGGEEMGQMQGQKAPPPRGSYTGLVDGGEEGGPSCGLRRLALVHAAPCWLLPLPPPFIFYVPVWSLSYGHQGSESPTWGRVEHPDGALPPHDPFTLPEMTWSPTQMTAKEAHL